MLAGCSCKIFTLHVVVVPVIVSLPSLVRGWRAALLLVVFLYVSSGNANAGCGDHLAVWNPNSTRPAISTNQLIEQSVLPFSPTPCSGGNCSESPGRSSKPIGVAVASGPQFKVAVSIPELIVIRDHTSTQICDIVSSFPIVRASSIFHPPRSI